MYSETFFFSVSLIIAISEILLLLFFCNFFFIKVGWTNRERISEKLSVEYLECLVACAHH